MFSQFRLSADRGLGRIFESTEKCRKFCNCICILHQILLALSSWTGWAHTVEMKNIYTVLVGKLESMKLRGRQNDCIKMVLES